MDAALLLPFPDDLPKTPAELEDAQRVLLEAVPELALPGPRTRVRAALGEGIAPGGVPAPAVSAPEEEFTEHDTFFGVTRGRGGPDLFLRSLLLAEDDAWQDCAPTAPASPGMNRRGCSPRTATSSAAQPQPARQRPV